MDLFQMAHMDVMNLILDLHFVNIILMKNTLVNGKIVQNAKMILVLKYMMSMSLVQGILKIRLDKYYLGTS